MAKSKGNVVTPLGLLEEYGSDALRYWAACGRPGTDTAFDVAQMKVGRRLAIKLLNASKFVLGVGVDKSMTTDADSITEPLDRALLAALAQVVEDATRAFDHYNYARALEVTETFFWSFTDDYVELVKERAYGGRGDQAARSAQVTLAIALSVLHRLFAPILPFVTEEVWSWWQEGSIHRADWPTAASIRQMSVNGDAAVLAAVGSALSGIRKAKSDAKTSMRTDVARAEISGSAEHIDRVLAVADDLKAAGRVSELVLTPSETPPAVSVSL
jgi:valyl-tRNA synthetase